MPRRIFSTLIRLTVKAGNEENLVAGTIFGKYEPRLVRINKFRMEVVPEGHMLFIYNTDRPGSSAPSAAPSASTRSTLPG